MNNDSTRVTRGGRFWIFLAVFWSAFLSFQCQPLMGRILLPDYGGGAAVWGVCLAYFQTSLLLSYVCVHWLANKFPWKFQLLLYLVLLGLTPFIPLHISKIALGDSPSSAVLYTLLFTIGLPYFVLGLTSPLLQVWYRDSFDSISPYKLYAASNVGSLTGLLAYPFVLEYLLKLDTQVYLWRGMLAAYFFIIVGVACSLRMKIQHVESLEITRVSVRRSLAWVALSGCASALLIVLSSYITEDIAPLPMLWVLPLSLFLLSYVLTFAGEKWHFERLSWWGSVICLLAIASGLLKGQLLATIIVVLLLSFSLFLLCNGALYRTRPRSGALTLFYLFMSLGGALGGILVTLVAPRFFMGKEELPITLSAAMFLLLFFYKREETGLVKLVQRCTGVAIALMAFWFHFIYSVEENVIARGRDFYGSHRVVAELAHGLGQVKVLVHGTTLHGAQGSRMPNFPLAYYGFTSGIGKVFANMPKEPRQIAAIGLGSGTLATYVRPEDTLDFYEISEVVHRLAREQFTFLENAKGKVQVIMGDGRLKLAERKDKKYDLLLLDAFNSDSLPVHLYTLEAFQLYWDRLAPEGVLCAHISNRYLDIKPALVRLGQELNIPTFWVSDRKPPLRFHQASDYIIFSKNEKLNKYLETIPPPEPLRAGTLWRDDYYSIFSLL